MRNPVYKILKKLGIKPYQVLPWWAQILVFVFRPIWFIAVRLERTFYHPETGCYILRGIKISDMIVDEMINSKKPTCWFRITEIKDNCLWIEKMNDQTIK